MSSNRCCMEGTNPFIRSWYCFETSIVSVPQECQGMQHGACRTLMSGCWCRWRRDHSPGKLHTRPSKKTCVKDCPPGECCRGCANSNAALSQYRFQVLSRKHGIGMRNSILAHLWNLSWASSVNTLWTYKDGTICLQYQKILVFENIALALHRSTSISKSKISVWSSQLAKLGGVAGECIVCRLFTSHTVCWPHFNEVSEQDLARFALGGEVGSILPSNCSGLFCKQSRFSLTNQRDRT